MDFSNIDSGVFDAPAKPRTFGPEIQPRTHIRRNRPNLPAAPNDLICCGLLAAEVILLVVFAEELFYGLVLPGISLILDLSGPVLFLIAVAAAVSAGARKIFRRRRRKG